ncbi:hypothetical protein [Actinomycetospora lemnae]|uniref:Uncharacterized protein n=1 Tax=Actinomycetospora lemnae TaxID=3019891 RepID=A0ABT5SYY4_9PSEU|nr:hypothetical protein [Actinomycetospora sp. DW7H6]MDD7967351.1 hypothetical protein [Actinomycetospora sp. DW7H6]
MPPSRVGSWALVASSLAVVAVAGTFDVLAGERPDHTLSLVLVAVAVGLLRWMLRGRLRGLFFLVNVAVVVQPVAHGVGELAQATGGLLPHSHDVPEELSGLTIQLAVALLVAVVAGSEPIVAFVATTVITAAAVVARLPVAVSTGPALLPARPDRPRPHDDHAFTRCRPRRGPPLTVGLAT